MFHGLKSNPAAAASAPF